MEMPSFMNSKNHIESKLSKAIEEYEEIFENNLPTEPGWDEEDKMVEDIKKCIKNKTKMEDYKPEIFEIEKNIEY